MVHVIPEGDEIDRRFIECWNDWQQGEVDKGDAIKGKQGVKQELCGAFLSDAREYNEQIACDQDEDVDGCYPMSHIRNNSRKLCKVGEILKKCLRF